MADGNESPTNGKRAQHRLRDMLTTAVGLVDRAANEETFLVVKSKDGGMATKAKKDDDSTDNEGGLRLPADAKQSLTDGIADTLEKLAAIAQQIQGCTVDESAECPPELASAIDEIADDLDELADEFMPKASPTEMRAKGAARKANKIAKKGKPFPGAAPPFGKDGKPKDKDEADTDAGTVAKIDMPTEGSANTIGSPPGGNTKTDALSKDPPGTGGGADESNLQPRGTTENPDVVMKSGRKMAKDRLDTLVKSVAMHKAASELHGQAIAMHKDSGTHLDKAMVGGGGLASLTKGAAIHKAAMGLHEQAHSLHSDGTSGIQKVLKEVGVPDNEAEFLQPPGAAPKGPPDSPKPAPAEPQVSVRPAPDTTGLAKADSVNKAEVLGLTKEAVDAALKEPLAALTKTLDGLKETKKAFDDAAQYDRLRGMTGFPRSTPNETVPAAPAAKPRMSWPADMSSDLKQRTAK